MKISFRILQTPSHSKGWGRLKASAKGKPIIGSRTGNEWVSADKQADIDAGVTFIATIQEQLSHGNGRTARKETLNYDFPLVAEEGAEATLSGSKTEILVSGARRA